MMTVRRASERGHANHGWLDSFHTFSFADYRDPNFMGFRSLRVINEDRVQPGKGFGTHSHQDMEIVTYVLSGRLAHEDSMGNSATILPGEIQRMSAGTGITHSEFNASSAELVHFLQIWLLPNQRGLKPSYEQAKTGLSARSGQFVLLASAPGGGGVVEVHSDVDVHAAQLAPNQEARLALRRGGHAWLHVARGQVQCADTVLAAGDAAALTETQHVSIQATNDAEVLLFDLA